MSELTEYYRLNNILRENAHYNIIYGERSNGKTYAVLEYALERYCKGEGTLGVIRRWDEDFKAKRGASLFSAHVENGLVSKLTKGKWSGVYYYSGRWFLCKREKGKLIKDDNPFGYAFSLSAMEHDKSTSFPTITTILFDEFLTRDAYMIDEFVIFTNVLSTIIRKRKNVKIFMLGNTVNMYSPYWSEMGLTHVKSQERGTIEVYTYGNSGLRVAVEYCGTSESGKESDVYFAFNNPKLNMIKRGEWEFDNYPHCPVKFKPMDIVYKFFIIFEDDILQCEVVNKDDLGFIYIHRKTTELKNLEEDLIYTTEYSPRPNYRRNLTRYYSKIEQSIVKLFKMDKVFYQDNMTGEIVRNFLLETR